MDEWTKYQVDPEENKNLDQRNAPLHVSNFKLSSNTLYQNGLRSADVVFYRCAYVWVAGWRMWWVHSGWHTEELDRGIFTRAFGHFRRGFVIDGGDKGSGRGVDRRDRMKARPTSIAAVVFVAGSRIADDVCLALLVNKSGPADERSATRGS